MAASDKFNPADITAAILAGGKGKRLGGRDKGLECLAGKRLIEHVIAGVHPQIGNLLICINRNNALYGTYAAICTDRAEGFLGPVAGIAAALAACRTEWLLTVPVDCPAPPADLAQRLYRNAYAAQAKLAVVHDGTRRQPLFAIYRHELAADAASALKSDLSVWRWQDECGAVEVDFSDVTQAFLNLNTEKDFRRWEKRNRD